MPSNRIISIHEQRPPSRRTALYRSVLERMTEQAVLWRSMGFIFAAGGLLAFLTLALPLNEGASKPAVAILGAAALGSAAFMWLGARRLPLALMSPLLALGTLLVSAGIVAQSSTASAYALMYVWIGFEAFFFLNRRHAIAHVVFVGACYAAAMVLGGGPELDAVARWVMTMGSVVIVGVLAGALHDRAEMLIERLADAARTDPLTGLLNRRGFEGRMEIELERARRTARPVSVIAGDLDHFKRVNDTFGHAAGDATLKAFAHLANDIKRGIDEAGRIGGEEFALVLPDTDLHGAYVLAERLRRAVHESLSVKGTGVTISFGIAGTPNHGDTAEQLMHRADQALYLAKQLGRDRSVLYSDEVESALAGRDEARPIEQVAAVLVLAEALDLRDTGTSLHSQTVGRFTEQIATELGLDDDRIERVRLAGLLHDVGKIGINDAILSKPGKLDDAEWAEMRKHPELGARILRGANLEDVAEWVIAHHERPDGRGYPAGLTDEQIPLEAKILAVADSYEAMTADRVYRAGMPAFEAISELQLCAGSQFDVAVVEAFVRVLTAVQSSPSSTNAT